MVCQPLPLILETLTPLHITDGAFSDITPLEYVVDSDGNLHFIDFTIFSSELTIEEQRVFAEAVENDNIQTVSRFMHDVWQQTPERFSDAVVWSAQAGDVAGLYHGLIEKPESRFFIKPSIRSGRKLYLPGSAIKGAIRTALIAWFFGNVSLPLQKREGGNAALLESHVMQYRTSKRLQEKGKPIQVWGNAEITKDPFKALKVVDAFFSQPPSMIKKIFHLKCDSVFPEDTSIDEGIADFAECVEPGARSRSELMIDSRLFACKRKVGRTFTIENMINACKSFAAKILKHERDLFFQSFDRDHSGSEICLLYDRFTEINRQENCFLLRVGRHGGSNSNSFNLYNQYGKEPLSRGMVLHEGVLTPLGWVSVTFDRHQGRRGLP